MPRPKIRVPTKQAVDLIRSGASDTVLMETFGLSRVGLGKLLKKLTDADEIQQFELNRRGLSSNQSQTVNMSAILEEVLYEIDGDGDQSVNAINSRKPDIDVKKKGRISGIGLESLPKRLASSGESTRFQFDGRKTAFERAETDSPELVTLDYSLPEDDPWHRNSRRWTLSGFVQKHKVIIAALVGGIAGMSLLAVGFLVFIGFDRLPTPPKLPTKFTAATDDAKSDADKEVQEATAILEAIARDRNDPKKSGLIVTGASQFQECLDNCKNAYIGVDDTEKLELSNCQKECLNTHSQLFKKMRQKYHGLSE